MNIESTTDYVEAIKNGDTAKFDELFQLYRKKLYLTALIMLNNPQDAEDAVQDSAVSAFSSINKLQHSKFFGTWITRILINCCNSIRSVKNRRRTVQLDESLWIEPLAEDEIDLIKALEYLKKDDKVIIVLRFFNDIKINEIAEILKISEGTVKSKLYRAIAKLKIILEKE